MNDDRINKLSQRFKTHSVGRRPAAPRNRERHSLYLDGDLVDRIDRVYRDVNHALHPQSVSKSVFLETLLEFGLEHIAEVKAALHTQQDLDSADDVEHRS